MSKVIAESLVSIGAVGFVPSKPIVFKSGVISPVYIDNRQLPYYPNEWGRVITAMEKKIASLKLTIDVIAGIETAGIPHSAALGFHCKKPSVFVRKEMKDHGTKKMIEGGRVAGMKVLLVEDHISSGASSLHGVRALKAEGADVVGCMAITSYSWKEAEEAFKREGVELYILSTFHDILAVAVKMKLIDEDEMAIIRAWTLDPYKWGKEKRHE